MSILNRRKGAVGGASADRIDPDTDPNAPPPSIEGERGIPPVNQRSYQSRGQLVAIGLAIVLLLGLMWFINMPEDKPVVANNDPMATKNLRFDEGRPTGGAIAPPRPAPTPPVQPFEPPKPPEPAVGVAGDAIQVVPKIDGKGSPQGSGSGSGARQLTPLEKRMRSKTVIFEERAPASAAGSTPGARPTSQPKPIPGLPGLYTDGSAQPVGFPAASSASGMPTLSSSGVSPAATSGGGSSNLVQGDDPRSFNSPASGGSSSTKADSSEDGGIAQILRPTRLEGASAAQFPNRTLMLARGKLIDCVLDTAISTVIAGMTKCSLTRDIHGEDGRVVLLDRGTELTGEYRSNLRVGQTRLGIVWARAKTPAGVIIELSSPATDSLGRSGVDGFVDTHFWEKYGAALLLSSLDDILSIIANRVSTNGNNIYLPPNTTATGRDAAAVALENNIRIPPTIVKNQGEHIAVFVARDLDFRTVYGYRGPATRAN